MTALSPKTKIPLVCWQSLAMILLEVKIPLPAAKSDVGDLDRVA